MEATTGTAFRVVTFGWPTGLAGTIGYRLVRISDGHVQVTRTTAGIVELGIGAYRAVLAGQPTGEYLLEWDDAGTPPITATEQITVIDAPVSVPSPTGVVLTAATLRALDASTIDFEALGYPDTPDGDVLLQGVIDAAAQAVSWIVGQPYLAVVGIDLASGSSLSAIYQLAVRYKAEGFVLGGHQDVIETLTDFALIQAFSVDGYSETRRPLSSLWKAGLIDADPRLNELLWPLMTPERMDYWMSLLGGGAGMIPAVAYAPLGTYVGGFVPPPIV